MSDILLWRSHLENYCFPLVNSFPSRVLNHDPSCTLLLTHVLNNFNEIDPCTAFNEVFNSDDYLFIRRVLFFTRDQRGDESLQEYYDALEIYGEACAFGDLLEDLLLSRFVTGINDSDVRQELLKQKSPLANFKKIISVPPEPGSLVTCKVESDTDDQYTVEQNEELPESSTQDDRLLCETCGLEAGSRKKLQSHIRQYHQQTKCKHCPKTFRTITQLKSHMYTHNGQLPFKCTVCEKSFFKKSILEIHMRIHSGERPYVCEMCGKSFKTACQLGKHKMVHTGERPHGCKICERRFHHKHHLKTHIQLVHKDTIYEFD